MLQVELTKTRHDMISYEKKAELLNQKAQEVRLLLLVGRGPKVFVLKRAVD